MGKNETGHQFILLEDDKHAKENYRPVTILSSVNKEFERLLADRIETKLDDRLSGRLTAYRKGNSSKQL